MLLSSPFHIKDQKVMRFYCLPGRPAWRSKQTTACVILFTLLKRGYNWNKSFDYRATGDYSLTARAEKEEKTNSKTSIHQTFV